MAAEPLTAQRELKTLACESLSLIDISGDGVDKLCSVATRRYAGILSLSRRGIYGVFYIVDVLNYVASLERIDGDSYMVTPWEMCTQIHERLSNVGSLETSRRNG